MSRQQIAHDRNAPVRQNKKRITLRVAAAERQEFAAECQFEPRVERPRRRHELDVGNRCRELGDARESRVRQLSSEPDGCSGGVAANAAESKAFCSDKLIRARVSISSFVATVEMISTRLTPPRGAPPEAWDSDECDSQGALPLQASATTASRQGLARARSVRGVGGEPASSHAQVASDALAPRSADQIPR
jgi:hypothetical protein